MQKYITECTGGECEYSISCPICGYEYDINLINVVPFERGKSYGKKLFFFCSVYKHLFSLNLYFHKGGFYIEYENEIEKIEEEEKETREIECKISLLHERKNYLRDREVNRKNSIVKIEELYGAIEFKKEKERV